jgi:UDP-sugar pyrophosphorylase
MSEEKKKALLDQVQWLDKITPGGLVDYCERARKLLADSKAGISPYDKYTPEVPEGFFLEPGKPLLDEFEALGLKELSKIGFVLIAGGLGERLGFSDIKIKLPIITIEEDYTYMKLYADYCLACREMALKMDPALDPATFHIPFAIMTSDRSHDLTIELMEKHNWYGLGKENVSLIRQEDVPAMNDNSATLALNEETGLLVTKPHGHGDIHSLMHGSGVAKRWQEQGKEWLVFLQDTNALAVKAVISMLGVSRKHDWEMNSCCVPRMPGEAMGAICHLKGDDNSIVINVEYN